mmetsp:Transcript_24663/g.79660  ORF Transcript_24663/g.79660 Transcript_24663/m.79660 type:complete len:337 (-) Transcript_24663:172-1182(-)
MLALPVACVHEIDGFLSMADSVARSMSSKSAPAPAPIVGKALGGECIHQVGDGRRFILESELALGNKIRFRGDPASGDGPAGLGALHIFQEGEGVGFDLKYDSQHGNEDPGLRLATSGWSVATWTRVKDGELERAENYQPECSYLKEYVGHALLGGLDVPAYYTAAPSPPQAIYDDYEFEGDPDDWRPIEKPRGNRFGCLLSTWHEERGIQGKQCESDGEYWHFEGADASLKSVPDGWHHVTIVGDQDALEFYVDGTLAGSMETGVEFAQAWSSDESWTMNTIGNIFDGDSINEGAEPWGALADLRVFNRKLSAAEIDLIYSPVATKLRSERPAAV